MVESAINLDVAVAIVSASIILSGILIGLGRAFSIKRVESFGVEELVQSIINAALIGAFASIIALVGSLANLDSEGICSNSPDILIKAKCNFEELNMHIWKFQTQTIHSLNTIGYYKNLELNFGLFSTKPFESIEPIFRILSDQITTLNLLLTINMGLISFMEFMSKNALTLILPLGLLLRSFFLTRKIGGILIGIAIGTVLVFPTFVLGFENPIPTLINATNATNNFNSNIYYAPTPIIDLNNNYAVAARIDVMSGRCFNQSNTSLCNNQTLTAANISSQMPDFSGDTTILLQKNSDAISKAFIYSVVSPIFALLISILFVMEIGGILGSELITSTASLI
jgi:hypothetical protein